MPIAPLQSITVYQGDTLIIDAVYQSAEGEPVDIVAAGITIDAYLNTRDDRELNIPVTITGTNTYRLQVDTVGWPLGRNKLAIRYTQDGIKRTADPLIVNVEQI